MPYLGFLLALLLGVAASSARAAGFRVIEIPATAERPALSGAVWSPCAQPPGEMKLGPYVLPVVRDCPVQGEKLPLVVISHGAGGSVFGHRDTAQVLADAGFIVVAINHPGDTALDRSRIDAFEIFVERPADIRRAVDFMLGPWPLAARIDPERVGLFGFSRGGYTGLVLIGAKPAFGKRFRLCEGKDTPLCDQVRAGTLPPLPDDPRIKAAVIAEPLSVFFTQQSYKTIKTPVQLWRSAQGGAGVTPKSVDELAALLPVKPDMQIVANAHHFAFLAPCPTALALTAPDICTDAVDFDRVAFHRVFNDKILTFFRKHLAVGRGQAGAVPNPSSNSAIRR